DVVPVDLEADDLPLRAARAQGGQRLTPDERALLLRAVSSEPKFEGRVALQVDLHLLRAVEVDVDEQQPRFDAGDVEREHASRARIEGAADLEEAIPDVHRAVPGHPDLVAEIAGVAGPRDVDWNSGDGAAGHAEVLQPREIDA